MTANQTLGWILVGVGLFCIAVAKTDTVRGAALWIVGHANPWKRRAQVGPRLVSENWRSDVRRILSMHPTAPAGAFETLHVQFKNDPEVTHPDSIAPAVLAEVKWISGGRTVLEIYGRWGDNAQPPHLSPGTPRISLRTVEFGNGAKWELDLAVHQQWLTDGFYAFNDENYDYTNWEHPKHKLTDGLYDVEIRLRGANVDKTFVFIVERSRHGFAISPKGG